MFFQNMLGVFLLNLKKYQILNYVFKKFIWSDKESSFFSKEMLNFFKDNNVKIYYTNSNLKAVVIKRFNRSLRELMMKEFVKNNNTIWYNILPKLMNIYNNRHHNTIKDKPTNINKSNEKYI